MTTTDNVRDLIARLNDEADLCRNDGATDIANLLGEAVTTLTQMREQKPAVWIGAATFAGALEAQAHGVHRMHNVSLILADPKVSPGQGVVALYLAPFPRVTIEPKPLSVEDLKAIEDAVSRPSAAVLVPAGPTALERQLHGALFQANDAILSACANLSGYGDVCELTASRLRKTFDASEAALEAFTSQHASAG